VDNIYWEVLAMNKKLISEVMVATMAASMVLSGCGGSSSSNLPKGAYDNEILTTTAVNQDKTVITVRIENNVASSSELEGVLEGQFPDVDFVLVHDGTINSEYSSRADLVNGTECDLILSRRLNTLDDIAADYLLDLSAEDFVDDYYSSAVESCASQDGRLYYLPGPSDVYGIVYDTVLFDEYGWELPHSYSEFVELLNTIREANISVKYVDENGDSQEDTLVPIQPSMMYPDMFQIVFNTYGYDDVFAGTSNYQWLTEYQNGEGSLVGHFEPAIEKFKKLFDDGILSLNDWDVKPVTRSNMMYTYHTTAMIIECQNATAYAESFSSSTGAEYHEVAMMPIWTSDNPDSDYVYSIPSYFMAINKKSAEESDDKKKLLLDIYSYLSSVEGQQMLIGDSPQISSVWNVPMEETRFSDAIRETIEEGRVINTFYLAAGEDSKQVEKQLRSTVPDMMNGTISETEWMEAADQVRDDFLAGTSDDVAVYGQVETTLTRLESAYTEAEMYQELTGADIGISLGGNWRYGVNSHFYAGDITDNSLSCVTPDKESPSDDSPYIGMVVTTTLTGEQIKDILNNASGADGSGGYYVAYGLTVSFNPWAEGSNRVVSIKTSDGKDLDLEATYQVAYFYGSLPEGSPAPESSLNQTWQDSFIEWLDSIGGTIKEPEMTLTLVYE
jgi:ABC-type glycerol-3-phosphate transport system substrate-binding protein